MQAKFAVGAAMRLIDAASDLAGPISESLGEDLMSRKAEARRQAFARPEFKRVSSAIGILEREGVNTKSLAELRKIFVGGEALGQSLPRKSRKVGPSPRR